MGLVVDLEVEQLVAMVEQWVEDIVVMGETLQEHRVIRTTGPGPTEARMEKRKLSMKKIRR